MINKTTAAVGFDEIDQALVAVAINFAASRGSVQSFTSVFLSLSTKGNGRPYLLLLCPLIVGASPVACLIFLNPMMDGLNTGPNLELGERMNP